MVDYILNVFAPGERRALVAIPREVFELPRGEGPDVEASLEVLWGTLGSLAIVLGPVHVLLSLPEQVGASSCFGPLYEYP
jgi:hypothetical protein